jgi:serine/threonine protein kinase
MNFARTVQFAHEHGLLHRDFKSGNILLDKDGEPHLTDFGMARLVEQESTITHSFEVLGTSSYMPPERAGRAYIGNATSSNANIVRAKDENAQGPDSASSCLG